MFLFSKFKLKKEMFVIRTLPIDAAQDSKTEGLEIDVVNL